MRKTATIIDSGRQHDRRVSAPDEAKVNSDEIDHLVSVLGSIVVAARDLADEDHARARRFVLAAGDLMSSRDRLKPADRQIFETALRDAAAQRHEY